MKTLVVFAGVVAFFLATTISSGAATRPSGGQHLTAAQLKQMIRGAHTQEQYTQIAHYFDERHNEFTDKAADELAEWTRRKQNTTGPAAKYPRPVDVAQNLYEYYAHEAEDAAFQADKYYRFAAGAAATTR